MWVLLMLPRFGGANHASDYNPPSKLNIRRSFSLNQLQCLIAVGCNRCCHDMLFVYLVQAVPHGANRFYASCMAIFRYWHFCDRKSTSSFDVVRSLQGARLEAGSPPNEAWAKAP